MTADSLAFSQSGRHQKQRSCRPYTIIDSLHDCELGIYYLCDGRIFDIVTEPIGRAVAGPRLLEAFVSHAGRWRTLHRAGLLDMLSPNIQDDFTALPRGRVAYDLQTERFVIFHGTDFDQAIRSRLIRAFNLPNEHTDESFSEHYATDHTTSNDT
jgi:hypothetical protein